MKTIEDILNTSDEVYLWEDNTTLDYCIETSKSFPVLLTQTNCLLCETSLLKGNERYLSYINETVKGAKITCQSCKQKYFLHLLVSMVASQKNQ